MFKKILIATDNSALMPSLAKYTAALFPDAEYRIISVVETTAGLGQMSGGLREQLEKMSWDAVEKIEGVLEGRGIKPRSIVVSGDPVNEIVETSKRFDVDLVSIGRHATTGIQEMKLGRVCRKVLEKIKCSALVMGNPVDPILPQRIANPTSDSKYSRRASEIAVQLAAKFGSKLDTVYIGTSAESRGKEAIEFVRAKAEKSNVRFNGIIGGNIPELEILERQKEYDLIIGSRGRTGAGYKFRFLNKGLALGNVERGVIAAAKVPILLISDNI
jgi:nucleotide-binding universal stress UspA family protein